jgi:hypothetical protein
VKERSSGQELQELQSGLAVFMLDLLRVMETQQSFSSYRGEITSPMLQKHIVAF